MAKKLRETLISKIQYLDQNSRSEIDRAADFAQKAHQGQVRLSGEQYIDHSLEVAIELAKLHLDKDAIISAILHDTIEDTVVTIKDIRKKFGPTVAYLVDGVTKLDRVRISKSWLMPFKKSYKEVDRYENQIETLRKMFVATCKDIRVILIKLADRICNLRTLSYLPEVKQRRIAGETMEIYAPIANRLGIGEFRCELEDLSFPYILPKEYEQVKKLAIPEIEIRTKYLAKLSVKVRKIIAKQGIKVKVIYRAKRWYSLFKKLQKYDNDISKIFDIVALRIIVPNVEDCYNVLGTIHNLWNPLPGRIKDYIALPKPNGYQSLHTTVFADKGIITEIQIRTFEMNKQAEFGIAAHWHYSQGKKSSNIPKKQLAWVNELLKWQGRIKKAKDWRQALNLDFFKDRIFIFTPRGEVKDLPVGATPVDFAYSIHTAVGNQCSGAIINGKISTLKTALQNGDIVEIIKDKKARPRADWLRFVKTEHAKESIRKYAK